ncbi:MAG: hypothetical protein HY268_28825 [Deltaproteobacteria bacterium]|nr:hypothetical protein [Deltaproteobacteria bacterium]
MAVSYDLNLRDYWHVLRKRRAVVAVVTLLVVAFSLGFSYLFRKTVSYRATASVKIEKTITPTGLFIEALSYSSGDMVATQAFVIKSYPVMTLVAKKLGLVDQNLNTEAIQHAPKLLATVVALAGRIDTQREQSTDIIHINATTNDPTFAQQLANATAEAFREYNLSATNKRILEAKNFIEAQLVLVQQRLKEAEEELRTFRQTSEIVATDAQASTLLAQLVAVEKDLLTIKEERRVLGTLLSELKEKSPSPALSPKDGASQQLTQNLPLFLAGDSLGPMLSKLRDQFADLTLQRNTLLLDLTPQHPQVEAVTSRIGEVLSTSVREISTRDAALATR